MKLAQIVRVLKGNSSDYEEFMIAYNTLIPEIKTLSNEERVRLFNWKNKVKAVLKERGDRKGVTLESQIEQMHRIYSMETLNDTPKINSLLLMQKKVVPRKRQYKLFA